MTTATGRQDKISAVGTVKRGLTFEQLEHLLLVAAKGYMPLPDTGDLLHVKARRQAFLSMKACEELADMLAAVHAGQEMPLIDNDYADELEKIN